MPRNLPRTLLATSALIAIATAAQAEDVTNARTAPLRTSTIRNGAADAISVTSTGSVAITGGTAITQDSNHAVANAGAVTIANANGAIGIDSLAGTTGDLTNSGTITLEEPYQPTDTDNDGDVDGPFALGSNRTGMRTQGAHTGKLTQSGTIAVEGNDSAGIALGGKLTGAFTHDGTTKILGDRSVAVSAQAIEGNVRLAGTVTAQGRDAIGARFAGDITGAMVVQGVVSATGYRYTTVPADPTKLDADDLLQGGPALSIEGNVTGGVILALAPKDIDPAKADEDGDGIDDAKEGTARVASYGAAPALQVGAVDRAITLGPVAGTASGFGLIIDGAVEGQGLYAGVASSGIVLGGRGGAVTVANGIGVTGTVTTTANGASSTALRLGRGATTPLLQNGGTISATSGNVAGALATAVRVDDGARLSTIRNAGVIKAVTGENGSATAIADASGSLTAIENAGTISATGAKAGSGRNIALDLSRATANLSIRQTQVAAGFAAPAIVGDVLLGAGDDVVDLADGTLTGDVRFGAGRGTLTLSGDSAQTGAVTFGAGADAMSLAGSSAYTGTVDFGGGADTLTLAGTARFTGAFANSGNLAVKLGGGTLDLNKPASIASLEVGSGGVLMVTLDKAAGAGSAYNVAGTASFAEGAKLGIRLNDVATAEGSYQVLTAGTLTGRDKLATNNDLVPFLYKAELNKNAAANAIVVDVKRRTTQELGLNRSGAAAYDAVFNVLGRDQKIEDVFLGITNAEHFRSTVGQMLPDHAGGTFEGVSLGVRTLGRQLQDPQGPKEIEGTNRFSTTLNMAFWDSDRGTGDSAAYKLSGYAWTATGEYRTDVGRFGATISYIGNHHGDGDVSDIDSTGFELAAHWRGRFGPVSAFARGSVGKIDYEGERVFTGKIGSDTVTRTSEAEWDGKFVSFAGGASVEGGSQFFFFRPGVTVDYVRLKEDGYAETGGGALDLTVDARKSDELAVNPSLTLGVDFLGMRAKDEQWFRLETEGGWREILNGGLGQTTARFAGGQAFTLEGDSATSGWFARLRAIGGSSGFTMGGEVAGEDRHGRVTVAVRGSVTIGW